MPQVLQPHRQKAQQGELRDVGSDASRRGTGGKVLPAPGLSQAGPTLPPAPLQKGSSSSTSGRRIWCSNVHAISKF